MAQFELSMGVAADVVKDVAERYGVQELQIRSTINHVGLADERLVIKAPKSEQHTSGLAVEAAALELVERSGPLSAATPKIVEFSTNPVFLVTTFLPGRIVEAATLHEIPLKDREALGHEIGAYVVSQAQQVDVNVVRQEVPLLEEGDTWGGLFEAVVGGFSSPAFPSTSKLAQQLYARWLQYQGNSADEQFIQGDLRLDNMVVSDDNRLHGVFDFGRAGVGTASCEVSPLVNLDTTIMKGAIDELRSASIEIDMDEVTVWDQMKKLTQLVYYINNGNYQDPPLFVQRACHIVSTHYPKWEWHEFAALKV